MEIIKSNDKDVITKSIEVLKNGGTLIYPTETAYGIGVDATNSEAVTKVLNFKKRPQGKAISIAVSNTTMASKYVDIGDSSYFFDQFLPGPITLVCKSKKRVDSRLESEKGTLGIRIPDYPLILEIIKSFGKPITATSANTANAKTPYSISDILENLSPSKKKLIDLIIDGGTLPKNPTSTVVDVSGNKANVFRQGSISIFKNQQKILDKISNSPSETIQIAKEFIQKNSDSKLFLLNGSLGAGKTHFVKGIAEGLGINETVVSPSYSYVNEYEFNDKKLIHVDAWRIESKFDLATLFSQNIWDSFVAIEWPSVIWDLEPRLLRDKKAYLIDIVYKNFKQRRIIISKAILE
ncbi:MAG: hypothetical protein KatS3mg085_147 [Candidatus Dojkabacteria bacterium]|nr:MAG: hypothetical protein KatS3mg085_147 [Candidatus Dojkabacteria bacterium]